MSEPVLVFGGIDAGGTTFKCGVSNAAGNLLITRRIAATTPQETLAGCADFFRSVGGVAGLRALGIASFGPVDIDPASGAYGTILQTPKPGWSMTDLRRFFAEVLNIDAVVDSDVNGALLAELTDGAGRGASSAAFITAGTGIGAGIYLDGAFAARPAHPEFGHIPVRRHPEDAGFPGVCPFHGDCLEGVASAPAVRARWGDPEKLPAGHTAWLIIADYIAQACCVLTLTLRLDRIIIGGGLMLAPQLLGLVQSSFDSQMAGYLGNSAIPGRDLIARAGLGDDAGLLGAILLATQSDGHGASRQTRPADRSK